eukprot:TRINITY_DN32030_c0_g1_i1.p1 TRINITY_DN32030_c0_g1~~TRINITY_DN32030_c0_g1_i1.p1  ORF type:complete len:294 (+),score=47.27 TRINITY_DN32030_c0_g1_i1:173-1054(+)
MRVIPGRLLSVLEFEVEQPGQSLSSRQRRIAPSPRGPSSIGSARTTTSKGAEASRGSIAARPIDSARSAASVGTRDSEGEDCVTAFDMLHTEQGFRTFQQWYQRQLCSGAENRGLRPQDLGILWPRGYNFPDSLCESAFVDFIRLFVECSDGEALDFFELLDVHLLGALSAHQVYIAIILVAALSSKQLTKCLFLHSKYLYSLLSASPRGQALGSRIQMLQQLLGAPWYLVSRVSAECGIPPLKDLTHEEFVEVMYRVFLRLDGGVSELTDFSQVIHPSERGGNQKSRTCAIL